jgi:Protein of unknown function (DUF3575)
MKKFILLFVFFLNHLCFSQEKKHIVLKTNSLNYVFSKGYNAAIEIETKKNHSINTNFEMGDTRYANEKNKYIVLIIDRRSYFARSKKQIYPSGFFVGPFLKYRYKDKNQPVNGPFLANKGVFQAHFLGLGGTAGYQNFIAKRIAVEIKIGLGGQICIASKGITPPSKYLPDGLIGLSFGIRI